MAKKGAVSPVESTIEDKLRALYSLQYVDSKIDKIRTVRGELPLEVQDLEDEIAGLETRLANQNQEVKNLENDIAEKKNAIKDAKDLIKKYEQQQMNVRNNREFDSLSKEIEYQSLETQLLNKRIKEAQVRIENLKVVVNDLTAKLNDKKDDLAHKKGELDAIVEETKKDEDRYLDLSKQFEEGIEERYLSAYKRIRENAFNGLAVVSIDRDACGGCFNKIPPQVQLDIAQRKKIQVCEHCGRVLVDMVLAAEVEEKVAKL